MDTRELALEILKKSKLESEVYITRKKHLSIDVLNREIESIRKGDTFGIALRVIKGKKQGFSFSSGTDIDDLIKVSAENLEFSHDDDFYCFASKEQKYKDQDLYDEKINTIPMEEKIKKAKLIETSAYEADKRITKTDSCSYNEGEDEVLVANSNGIIGSYKTNYCGGFVSVIAQANSDTEEGMEIKLCKKWGDFDPEKIGKKAAENAVKLLGGRLIESAKMPVILEANIGAEFMDCISSLLLADNVQKGKSAFRGRIGEKVSSPIITMVDDPTFADGLNSAPFDDEGTSSRKNILIEAGILTGFMHDSYTAKKEGAVSTANAVRISFKSAPTTGSTNFYLENGKKSPGEIIGSVNKGILITKVMAMHSVNPISGDFSVGASGIMIENGKETFPVRSVTLAGNLIELLKAAEDKANDLEFFPMAGNCGCPTLLIGSLDIGGK